MSYENAPATRMLATHCAVCSRPLLDAQSVELGIGPDCRKKYGFNIEVDEAARKRANELVYAVALGPVEGTPPAAIADALRAVCAELMMLGFVKLADTLLRRNAAVVVTRSDAGYAVNAAYNEVFNAELKAVPGRRWDREAKCWRVPKAARMPLWRAMQRAFHGYLGVLLDDGAPLTQSFTI